MGKTIICSDIYPYNTVVEHGVDGFLVRKPREWYKYMKQLINNPEQAFEMGARLQAKIRERYDVEKITKQRYDLYTKTARYI